MSTNFIDTDVIVRFLTGDDPGKRAACLELFERVGRGELVVTVPHSAIADAVVVLHSPRLYRLPKSQVAQMLTALLSLRGVRLHERHLVLAALELYGGNAQLDFTDAIIIAASQQENGAIVYSYDKDYDRFDGVVRREP